VKIGPNGKPLRNEPELTAQQQRVVSENKSVIRRDVNKIGKWLNYTEEAKNNE
jgi:hypothetical protein